jgi:hypothetical protein
VNGKNTMPNTPPHYREKEQNNLQRIILGMGGIYLTIRFLGDNIDGYGFFISAGVIYAAWWIAGYIPFLAFNLPRWIGKGAYRILSNITGYIQFFHAKRYEKSQDEKLSLVRGLLLKTNIFWLIFLVPIVVRILHDGNLSTFEMLNLYYNTAECVFSSGNYNNCIPGGFIAALFITEKLINWVLPIGIFSLWFLAGYKNGLSFGFKDFRKQSEFGYNRSRFHSEETDKNSSENKNNDSGTGNGRSENANNNRNSSGFSNTSDKPYGTEKHHPDDVPLWNIINDPNAAEGEQMNALRAIKNRETKRQKGQN